jgi:hypothetical protein
VDYGRLSPPAHRAPGGYRLRVAAVHVTVGRQPLDWIGCHRGRARLTSVSSAQVK